MGLSEYFIPLLLFSLILIGLSNFNIDMADVHSRDVNNVSSLSVAADIEEQAAQMQDSIESSQITGTALDIPLVVISGIWNVVKLTFITIVNIWGNLIDTLAVYLHIPGAFIAILKVFIALLIIFEFITWAHSRTRA